MCMCMHRCVRTGDMQIRTQDIHESIHQTPLWHAAGRHTGRKGRKGSDPPAASHCRPASHHPHASTAADPQACKMTDCAGMSVCLSVCVMVCAWLGNECKTHTAVSLCVWSKQWVTHGWMNGHTQSVVHRSPCLSTHSERHMYQPSATTCSTHQQNHRPPSRSVQSVSLADGEREAKQTDRHDSQSLINVCICIVTCPSGRSTETDRSENPTRTIAAVYVTGSAPHTVTNTTAQPQLSMGRRTWLR